jgi:hypothetical protein
VKQMPAGISGSLTDVGPRAGDFGPLAGSASGELTDRMFVRDEVPVDVGFEVARDRLAKLDSWFLAASDHAYGEGIAGLARIGPRGPVPGISRLAEIRFQSLAAHDESAGLALRWEARGPGGRLFPVLDADLTLAPAGENAAVLALAGAYRPPLGGLGAELDRLLLHRVAEATIRDFLERVATALTQPTTAPA